VMVRSALLFCLMLLLGVDLIHAQVSSGQDIARLQSGVVKITAKPPSGTTSIGTGFIVRLETNAAYIVTAAHVIAGDPNPKVEFFTKQHVQFPAEVLPGAEGGDDVGGLALLLVKGKENLPSGIGALPLASTSLMLEDMVMIGFPLGAGPWHVTKGNIGSRQGRTIYFDPRVDSGNSGGPIIQKGKVVGVVMAARSSGQGITVRGVQDYIEGFGITAQERTSAASMAAESSPPPAAKAKPEPRPMTQDREVTGKDGAPMVLIPAGEFQMGSPDGDGDKDEHPRHRVALSAFYLDKYEVTNRLFQQFVQQTSHRTTAEQEGKAYAMIAAGKWEEVSGAHWRKPEGGETVFDSNREEHPVVSVSWEDTQAYCRWTGKRLPTEAEFEYATRAGTETKYWWGNGNPGSRRVANIGDESLKRQYSDWPWPIMTGYDDGSVRTAPVGSFEANPFGLHDMTGNVWEWTGDWYDEQYYGSRSPKNPKGPSKGDYRVLRGGSWVSGPDNVRSANRNGDTPAYRYFNIGFRCAQDSPK
jgi:formylglycine-generating enzyme required for sulfatase activity